MIAQGFPPPDLSEAVLVEGKDVYPLGYCKPHGKDPVYVYIKTSDPKKVWKYYSMPDTEKGKAALAKSSHWDAARDKIEKATDLVGASIGSKDDLKSLSDAQKAQLKGVLGDEWESELSQTLDTVSSLEKGLSGEHDDWMAGKAKGAKGSKAKTAPVASTVEPEKAEEPKATEEPSAEPESKPEPKAEPDSAAPTSADTADDTAKPDSSVEKDPGKSAGDSPSPDALADVYAKFLQKQTDAYSAGEDAPTFGDLTGDSEFVGDAESKLGSDWLKHLKAADLTLDQIHKGSPEDAAKAHHEYQGATDTLPSVDHTEKFLKALHAKMPAIAPAWGKAVDAADAPKGDATPDAVEDPKQDPSDVPTWTPSDQDMDAMAQDLGGGVEAQDESPVDQIGKLLPGAMAPSLGGDEKAVTPDSLHSLLLAPSGPDEQDLAKLQSHLLDYSFQHGEGWADKLHQELKSKGVLGDDGKVNKAPEPGWWEKKDPNDDLPSGYGGPEAQTPQEPTQSPAVGPSEPPDKPPSSEALATAYTQFLKKRADFALKTGFYPPTEELANDSEFSKGMEALLGPKWADHIGAASEAADHTLHDSPAEAVASYAKSSEFAKHTNTFPDEESALGYYKALQKSIPILVSHWKDKPDSGSVTDDAGEATPLSDPALMAKHYAAFDQSNAQTTKYFAQLHPDKAAEAEKDLGPLWQEKLTALHTLAWDAGQSPLSDVVDIALNYHPETLPTEEYAKAVLHQIGKALPAGYSNFIDPSQSEPEKPSDPVSSSSPSASPVVSPKLAAPKNLAGWTKDHYEGIAKVAQDLAQKKGKTSDEALALVTSPEFVAQYGSAATDALNAVRVVLGKPAYLKLPNKFLTQTELESLADIAKKNPAKAAADLASGGLSLSEPQHHALQAMLTALGHPPVEAPSSSPASTEPSDGLSLDDPYADTDAVGPAPKPAGSSPTYIHGIDAADITKGPAEGYLAKDGKDGWWENLVDLSDEYASKGKGAAWAKGLAAKYGPDWKKKVLYATAVHHGINPKEVPGIETYDPPAEPKPNADHSSLLKALDGLQGKSPKSLAKLMPELATKLKDQYGDHWASIAQAADFMMHGLYTPANGVTTYYKGDHVPEGESLASSPNPVALLAKDSDLASYFSKTIGADWAAKLQPIADAIGKPGKAKAAGIAQAEKQMAILADMQAGTDSSQMVQKYGANWKAQALDLGKAKAKYGGMLPHAAAVKAAAEAPHLFPSVDHAEAYFNHIASGQSSQASPSSATPGGLQADDLKMVQSFKGVFQKGGHEHWSDDIDSLLLVDPGVSPKTDWLHGLAAKYGPNWKKTLLSGLATLHGADPAVVAGLGGADSSPGVPKVAPLPPTPTSAFQAIKSSIAEPDLGAALKKAAKGELQAKYGPHALPAIAANAILTNDSSGTAKVDPSVFGAEELQALGLPDAIGHTKEAQNALQSLWNTVTGSYDTPHGKKPFAEWWKDNPSKAALDAAFPTAYGKHWKSIANAILAANGQPEIEDDVGPPVPEAPAPKTPEGLDHPAVQSVMAQQSIPMLAFAKFKAGDAKKAMDGHGGPNEAMAEWYEKKGLTKDEALLLTNPKVMEVLGTPDQGTLKDLYAAIDDPSTGLTKAVPKIPFQQAWHKAVSLFHLPVALPGGVDVKDLLSDGGWAHIKGNESPSKWASMLAVGEKAGSPFTKEAQTKYGALWKEKLICAAANYHGQSSTDPVVKEAKAKLDGLANKVAPVAPTVGASTASIDPDVLSDVHSVLPPALHPSAADPKGMVAHAPEELYTKLKNWVKPEEAAPLQKKYGVNWKEHLVQHWAKAQGVDAPDHVVQTLLKETAKTPDEIPPIPPPQPKYTLPEDPKQYPAGLKTFLSFAGSGDKPLAYMSDEQLHNYIEQVGTNSLYNHYYQELYNYYYQELVKSYGDDWPNTLKQLHAYDKTVFHKIGEYSMDDMVYVAKKTTEGVQKILTAWDKGGKAPYAYTKDVGEAEDLLIAALVGQNKPKSLKLSFPHAHMGVAKIKKLKEWTNSFPLTHDWNAYFQANPDKQDELTKEYGPGWPHVLNALVHAQGAISYKNQAISTLPKPIAPYVAPAPYTKPANWQPVVAKASVAPASPISTSAADPAMLFQKAPTTPADSLPTPPPAPTKVADAPDIQPAPPPKPAKPKLAPDPAPEGYTPGNPTNKPKPKVGTINALPTVEVDGKSLSVLEVPAPTAVAEAVPHLPGPVHQLYTSADGAHWAALPSVDKHGKPGEPHQAHAVGLFSRVAAYVKPGHIQAKALSKAGALHATYQVPELASSHPTLADVPPSALSESEQADVASEHALDWLFGNHHTHGGRLLRTKDGRVVGVGKDDAFKYQGHDELSVDYHPGHADGEPEPYYNRFWRDWVDGKHDFDPTVLRSTIESIESIDPAVYAGAVADHAKLKHKDQESVDNAVLYARNRHLRMRGDFEKFLTGLYRERTGDDKGAFTFDDGWKPSTAVASAPKPKLVTFSSAQHAQHLGIDVKGYDNKDDAQNASKKGVWATLAVPKGSAPSAAEKKIDGFLKDLGLKELGPKVTGSVNVLAFVDKAALEAAKIDKEPPVQNLPAGVPPIPPTSAKPRYFPKWDPHRRKFANVADLDTLQSQHLGYMGKSIHMDGPAMEGQVAKVIRRKEKDGDHLIVHFKLRKPAWSALTKKGDSSSWDFQSGYYDKDKDAFVPDGSTGEKGTPYSDKAETRKWSTPSGEIHLVHTSGKYAYMGSVYAKIKDGPGVDPKKALAEMLDKMKPGLSKDLLHDPTPEERRLMCLSRLLWAKAPSASDALDEEELSDPKVRTEARLMKELQKAGVTPDEIDSVKEVEVHPGHMTHVLPGRYKKIGAKFLFQGIGSLEGAVNIVQSGLMGIHDRNMAHMPDFGGSYSADVSSGSADGTLCRIMTGSGGSNHLSGHPFGGQYRAIVAPDVLDRLDCYSYNSDTYGKSHGSPWASRKSVEDNAKYLKSSYSAGNEISFRKGVDKSKIIRMACANEGDRAAFVHACKKKGIHEVNGVPVEEFCVVADQGDDVYEKYVKPLGF